jgi:hypothetical protein
MIRKSGLMREFIEKLFGGKKAFLRTLTVHAEGEPDGGTGGQNEPPKKDPVVNYEDLIAKARKEEKDKLYPKITAIEGERDSWIKKCNEHLVTIGQKDLEIEELKKQLKASGKDDSAEVKKLKEDVQRLTGELETAKKNVPDEKAIEDRIKAEYEVRMYRTEKLAEFKDAVIPELVTGSTKEEIDKTLEASKKRFKDLTDSILKGAGSRIPPVNVSSSKIDVNNFKMEDLAKMDPGSEEYKEFRKKLGLK